MSDAESLLDQMYGKDRVIITAQLSQANGAFLQPTGFPDIGSCIYTDANGKKRCLVESEQSMANRLEAVCMKAPGYWVDELNCLPVIEVRADGTLIATNLTEPHRIASSYVLESHINGSEIKDKLETKLELGNGGSTWPLDKRDALEKLIFALDPGALIHGFQFVQWKFVGLRQTRLLSARLECELAEEPEVQYGMVKFDLIEPGAQAEGTNKGQSIAAKSRVVPAKNGITATFDIDLLGLKNLSLSDPEKKFLLALALWKVGALLSNKPAFDARSRQTSPALRLRADCYLSCPDSVTWDSGPAKLSEMLAAISNHSINFDSLASTQGFAVTGLGDGKPHLIKANYTKRVNTPTAPPPASADTPQTEGQPQES